MTARQSSRHFKGRAARGASSLRGERLPLPPPHGPWGPFGLRPQGTEGSGDRSCPPRHSLPAHCSPHPSQTCMCPCVFSLNF